MSDPWVRAIRSSPLLEGFQLTREFLNHGLSRRLSKAEEDFTERDAAYHLESYRFSKAGFAGTPLEPANLGRRPKPDQPCQFSLGQTQTAPMFSHQVVAARGPLTVHGLV
jgi:hypothetical protein